MYETVKKKIKESEGFSNRGYFLKYKGADGKDIQEDFMTIGYGHKCVDGDPYQPNVDYSTEVLEQQFESHRDCVLGGYKAAHNAFKVLEKMEEFEREYIEKEQVVIKFECKGLQASST